MHEVIKIDNSSIGLRIDKWIKVNLFKIPQSLIEKDLRNGRIKVNNKKVKSSYKLKSLDVIYLYNVSYKSLLKSKTKTKSNKVVIKDTEKDIIDDNQDFIVINKKSGLPVQGGTKVKENLINILSNSSYFENIKPYIVHRLDKDTSGVLIIAKTRNAAQQLTSLFRIRKIHKTYLAIVHGNVSKSKKILVDNLITFEKNKKLVQKAITHVKVIKNSDSYSFLELNPITGRKHQLRKQLYNIGNPIIGDEKYFLYKNTKVKYKKKILMLHAYKIKFMINNVQYNFKADYNESFAEFLKSKI